MAVVVGAEVEEVEVAEADEEVGVVEVDEEEIGTGSERTAELASRAVCPLRSLPVVVIRSGWIW